MDLLLRSIFQSDPGYQLIFGYFEDDGFQYKFPSSENSGYINFTSNSPCEYYESGKTEYYDMRCRMYGEDIKTLMMSPNLNQTIMISDPYFYFVDNTDNTTLGTTYCGYNLKNSTLSNFSLIPPQDRQLNYAICIDFELQQIENAQNLLEQKGLYFFIMFKDSVFYHPNFETMNDSWNSITEFEFNENDDLQDEECLYFNNTIVADIKNFYQGINFTTSFYEYTKKGVYYIATLAPIDISRTGEIGNFSGLILVIVEPKNLIFEVFFFFCKLIFC
jgi:hypothetical protein